MIFDAHTDVLFDIINGNHSFDYHLNEMEYYHGAVLNYYFKGNESYSSFLFVLERIKQFYNNNCDTLIKRHFILGIEGLGPLKYLKDIKTLHDAGIRIVTLTWNDMNKIATGTYQNKLRGLTAFGKKVLKKLKEYNIVLDLSHLNEKSFYDVINSYDGPMIVSHSNIKCLKRDERNLNKNQLKQLLKRRILVGVNSYSNFAGKIIDDFINIIVCLKKYIGIDLICLGLDFDYYLANTIKIGAVKGLQTPKDIPNILKLLKQKGFKEKEIKKIFYENIINFFKSSLIL